MSPEKCGFIQSMTGGGIMVDKIARHWTVQGLEFMCRLSGLQASESVATSTKTG
jgi:hypothetical protein